MNNNPWGNENDYGGIANDQLQGNSSPTRSGGSYNPMLRTSPNWISLGIALAFILCFLFLPFVKVVGLLPLTGMSLMTDVNAIMCLPLIAGALMVLASLLLNEKLSAVIGGATAVLVLVLLLCSGSMMGGADIASLVGEIAQQYIGFDITGFLAPKGSLGCIFCIALACLFAVVELVMANGISRPSTPISQNPWPDL